MTGSFAQNQRSQWFKEGKVFLYAKVIVVIMSNDHFQIDCCKRNSQTSLINDKRGIHPLSIVWWSLKFWSKIDEKRKLFLFLVCSIDHFWPFWHLKSHWLILFYNIWITLFIWPQKARNNLCPPPPFGSWELSTRYPRPE